MLSLFLNLLKITILAVDRETVILLIIKIIRFSSFIEKEDYC